MTNLSSYHPSYRALDSVGNEIAQFETDADAVDYWTSAPIGADIMQYWDGHEWEPYNPRTFAAD